MTWPFSDRLSNNSVSSGIPAVNQSSFADFLRRQAPELLRVVLGGGTPASAPGAQLPHGTTIVALRYSGGVLIAGDRRSTQGNMIAGRDVRKVYITDDYTAAGIAGTAAIAVEFARLYAVELEHYEKLEGVPLTFAGKVNRLAIMVRGNLAAAMQGLVALPLLAGYDIHAADPESAGRIVLVRRRRRMETSRKRATSRSGQGRSSPSHRSKSCTHRSATPIRRCGSPLRPSTMPPDDDSATGGPDLVRGIFPTAVTIGADGRSRCPSAASPSWPAISSKVVRAQILSAPTVSRGVSSELPVFHLA